MRDDDNKALVELINSVLEGTGAVLVNPEKGTASEVTWSGKTFPDVYRYLMEDRYKITTIDEQMTSNIIRIIRADSIASDSWIDLLTRQDSYYGDSTLSGNNLMFALGYCGLMSNPGNIPHYILVVKTIIEECGSKDLSEKLIDGLAKSDYMNRNVLYKLMEAARSLTVKSPAHVPAIVGLIGDIVTKFGNESKKLAAALSAQRTIGADANENALHLFADALMNAAKEKSEENVSQIAALFETILSKFDADQLKTALFEHKYKYMSAFDKLMDALSKAAKETPSKVQDIKKIIETIFTKLKPDQLIDIFIDATGKSSKHLPDIAEQMITAFSKLEPKQLAEALSKKITEGKFAGANALYRLINALSWAAEKSPGVASRIAALITTVLKVLDANQLAAALSAQIAEGEFTGENALYQLINALSLATEKSPSEVSTIAALIETVISKLDDKQLAVALSAQITEGKFTGANALYRLMNALSLAAEKSPGEVSSIVALIQAVIFKLDDKQLAVALSAQITEGQFAGENALYQLMNALAWAARESPGEVPQIAALIQTVISKLDANQLETALSAQITAAGEWAGENALHRLMYALFLAAKKSPGEVSTIATLITTVLDKLNADQLAAALSAQITAGPLAGVNSLYRMIDALDCAVRAKSPENISRIAKLIGYIFTSLENKPELTTALSAQITAAGEWAGENALHRLINALFWAVEKSPGEVSTIATLITTVLKVLDANQLAAALSAQKTAGQFAGANALYKLMVALSLAAKKSSSYVSTIAALIETAISKLDANQLAAALSAQRTAENEYKGENAFNPLMRAIDKILDQKIDSPLFNTFFDLLAKVNLNTLNTKTKMLILSYKKKLNVQLTAYLNGNKDNPNLSAMCNENTMLGKFIDLNRGPLTSDHRNQVRTLVYNQKVEKAKQAEREKGASAVDDGWGAVTETDIVAHEKPPAVNSQSLNNENTPDQLVTALIDAIEKSPEHVPHILAQITTSFSKLTGDELAAALSTEIAEGKFAGANALYRLMFALALAAKKPSSDVSTIAALIKTVLEKLDANQLEATLSAQITEGQFAGENALYRLIAALSWAAEKSPGEASRIAALIKTVLEKLDANQLEATLSAQITEGQFAGENALYRLMAALSWAAVKSPGKVSRIAALITIVLKNLGADQLARLLSAQIAEGEFTGANALYRLMNALSLAAKKSPGVASRIAALITTVLKVLDANQLAAALSAQITAGQFAGENALYQLMNALAWAARESPGEVPQIAALIQTVISKLDANQLETALSAQITAGEWAGENALYRLINALSWAVEKSPGEVSTIATLITTVLKVLDANQLAAALSAQKTAGPLAGVNSLYRMIDALDDAVRAKSPENISRIAKLIGYIFTSLENKPELTTALSAQITAAGEWAGENALYRLINALSWAVEKSPGEVSTIATLITTVLDKLNADQLAAALSAQITAGQFAGANALYKLMVALSLAAKKSSSYVSTIAALIETVISKLDANQLAAALSAQRTAEDEYKGENAFYPLLIALDRILDQKIDSPLFNTFFNLLANINHNALTTETKRCILDYKAKLKDKLTAYLDNNKDNSKLSAMCASNTMLGALIDHQRGFVRVFVKASKTTTRKKVDELLVAKQQVLKQAAEVPYAKEPAELPDTTQVINAPSEKKAAELPHEKAAPQVHIDNLPTYAEAINEKYRKLVKDAYSHISTLEGFKTAETTSGKYNPILIVGFVRAYLANNGVEKNKIDFLTSEIIKTSQFQQILDKGSHRTTTTEKSTTNPAGDVKELSPLTQSRDTLFAADKPSAVVKPGIKPAVITPEAIKYAELFILCANKKCEVELTFNLIEIKSSSDDILGQFEEWKSKLAPNQIKDLKKQVRKMLADANALEEQLKLSVPEGTIEPKKPEQTEQEETSRHQKGIAKN